MQALRRSNKIENEIYTFYTNDSLKINFQFFGDYEILNSKDSIYKKYLKVLSGILNSNKMKVSKNIIVSLNTNTEPWFQTALVFTNKKFLTSAKWKTINMSGRNFREKTMNFENYDVRIIDLQYNFRECPFLWITWLNEKENLRNSLLEETDTILTKIKFGKNFSSFIPINPFRSANNAFGVDLEGGGNYLLPLFTLKGIKKNYDTSRINNFFSQALNTYKSFAGVENKNMFLNSETTIASLKTVPYLKNNEAKDVLLRKISKSQVVMFNEAHLYPRQRFLVSSLLDTLYKLNFKVLALEAIVKEPEKNVTYPNLQTGFYVREPQMANLIRHAISLGFRIVAYEDTLENSNGREITEAENLFNSTLKKNPSEKIIVLAGVQHIEENTLLNRKRWMASYFKQFSGVNPLTINQTALDNLSFSNDELIFFEGNDVTNKLGVEFSNDVYLINHINPKDFKIKPGIADCNLKINLTLDSNKRIENQLIELIYNSFDFEESYKIPVYTTLIANSEKFLNLKVPLGEYYVIVKNSIGQTLFKKKFIINDGCKVE